MLVSEIEEMLRGVHNPRAGIALYSSNVTSFTSALLLTGTNHDALGLSAEQGYIDFYHFPAPGIISVPNAFTGIRAFTDDDKFVMASFSKGVYNVTYGEYKTLILRRDKQERHFDIAASMFFHGNYAY